MQQGIANAQPLTTAGDRFKNVTVLKDMPADQMGKVMNLMSAALGVNCSHCHDGNNFASENATLKDPARKMLTMTLAINRDYFDGATLVTCNTCHQGQPVPVSTISLEALKTHPLPTQAASAPLPSVDEVLASYAAALGGEEKLKSIRTRHFMAQRIEPHGQTEAEELWQSSQGKSKMNTNYGSIVVSEGFDGERAWKKAADQVIELKPDEALHIQREIAIAFGLNIEQAYDTIQVDSMETIQQRPNYVLAATNKLGMREALYFDCENGLIARRVASVPTVLGSFDYQVDYQDYQKHQGILYPASMRFSVPNIQWTRQVSKVEWNTPFPQ
jgi:hypothetical protein